MLYLVIGKTKEGRVLPDKKEFLKLVVSEWETVISQRDKGKVVDVYGFDDGTGGVVIYDVDSEDELQGLLKELPLDPYADWRITRLFTAETGLEKAKYKLAEIDKIRTSSC